MADSWMAQGLLLRHQSQHISSQHALSNVVDIRTVKVLRSMLCKHVPNLKVPRYRFPLRFQLQLVLYYYVVSQYYQRPSSPRISTNSYGHHFAHYYRATDVGSKGTPSSMPRIFHQLYEVCSLCHALLDVKSIEATQASDIECSKIPSHHCGLLGKTTVLSHVEDEVCAWDTNVRLLKYSVVSARGLG